MELLFYDAERITARTDLMLRKFAGWFTIYSPGVAPVDRTNTIKLPVNVRSLFPVPKLKECKQNYEQACDERALDILQQADALDLPIHVFWSGGVDSTCVLVALLKATLKSTRDRLVVLLSEDSINEYPLFYERHIRGKVRCKSSVNFPAMLGKRNAILINGEGNDQLFGSDIIADAISQFGADAVNGDYDATLFHALFEKRLHGNTALADFYVQLFERLKKKAPIDINSNFLQLWWINFATKWQTVFMRMLTYTAPENVDKISKEWVEKYYLPFFMTENFQQWSMNNIDKRISSSWASYKYPAKELIYNYIKDPVYRDRKLKRGSLAHLILYYNRHDFITADYQFPHELEPAEFYRENHDFR